MLQFFLSHFIFPRLVRLSRVVVLLLGSLRLEIPRGLAPPPCSPPGQDPGSWDGMVGRVHVRAGFLAFRVRPRNTNSHAGSFPGGDINWPFWVYVLNDRQRSGLVQTSANRHRSWCPCVVVLRLLARCAAGWLVGHALPTTASRLPYLISRQSRTRSRFPSSVRYSPPPSLPHSRKRYE